MLDFCYLVNPYFPTQKMKDEIQASFDTLLTEYPSGMHVNSLLAAKNFNVHQENIVIGNGAAELIKSLMEGLKGKTGFVRPTFEEYPNRYEKDQSVSFTPSNEDFSYSADDLIGFFCENRVDNMVIVNPDNPTGNFIPQKDLLKLIKWTKEHNIRLVVDESFVDFADDADSSIIDQNLLTENHHLYVMKSISKSYGIPGIRLGVLASGDLEMISRIKKDVSIWNINSFGEFFMQIFEKYRKTYVTSLEKIKSERLRFQQQMGTVNGIRVVPSQANYVMIELSGEVSPKDLTKKLLINNNILIKDLSEKIKTGNYLRIAIRDTKDNDLLLKALKEELGTKTNA